MVRIRKLKVANPGPRKRVKAKRGKRARSTVATAVRRNKSARKSHRKRAAGVKRANPAPVLVTLGAINPQKKGSKSMARTKKSRGGKKSYARKSRKRNGVKVYMKNRSHHRRRNPTLMGTSVGSVDFGKAILGGLLGVTATKLIVPMLPGALIASPIMRIFAAGAVAWGAGFAGKAMGGNAFGSAVQFGGFMQAASLALNALVPSIGSQIGLSGRGMGAFASGSTALPYNPFNGQTLAPGTAAVRAATGANRGMAALPAA